MRKLRPLKSPYRDFRDREIWHGNILGTSIVFARYEVIYDAELNVWYARDNTGAYLVESNRYRDLSKMTHLAVIDDTAKLVVCDE